MPAVAHQRFSVEAARAVQAVWSQTALRDRLGMVRRLRSGIAAQARVLLDDFPRFLQRSRADSLTAELIPLAEACRFLELEGERILRPERLSTRGRPFWLRTVDIEVRREPLGVVLLIGPSNYPLFLTGVQTIQALVAGNAVMLKPGRGAAALSNTFGRLLGEAGFPEGLVTVLDESVAAARDAIGGGVNKIVLTGSVESGRAVLRDAAEEIVPVVAELSGCDPVFILPGANSARVAAALRFGFTLNGGATCIAPKRVFVHETLAPQFKDEGVNFTVFRNEEEALAFAAASPYALGATIFGEEVAARALARRVNAGVVVVNDMIVPTADPRAPFGGRGRSGYGSTRGALGLLEMTAPKTVIVQRGRRLRHFEPAPPNAEFFLAYLSAVNAASLREKMGGWRRLATLARTRKVKP